jgi:methionine salvage enolase-phosphatase E1
MLSVSECARARRNLEPFLRRTWNEPETREDVQRLVQEASLAQQGAVEASVESVAALVYQQMDANLKTGPLKTLQGHIWRHGYAAGELLGEMFADVPPALESWARRGQFGGGVARRARMADSSAAKATAFASTQAEAWRRSV